MGDLLGSPRVAPLFLLFLWIFFSYFKENKWGQKAMLRDRYYAECLDSLPRNVSLGSRDVRQREYRGAVSGLNFIQANLAQELLTGNFDPETCRLYTGLRPV